MNVGRLIAFDRRVRSSRILVAGILAVAAFQLAKALDKTNSAAIETAPVTRGSFVETLVCQGEVKALRSRIVNAPTDVGDLQILKLAKNGSLVRRGDIVVVFDSTKVRQARAEKRAALGQAAAEVDRARAEGRLAGEATRTEQLERRYDVERARLEVGTRDVISRLDGARAELLLRSAERQARETDTRFEANVASAEATTNGFINKRDAATEDVATAERQLAAMIVRAPVDGRFIVQRTWRGITSQSEFREGDRVWAGAFIAEIPDPAALYVTARVDEVDRGRVERGTKATVRSEAVPGLEIPARLTTISTLSRPDFSSWPFQRVFDLGFTLDVGDVRLAVGLSSSIQVEIERLEDVLLIPARALIDTDGRSVVYVQTRHGFNERQVSVAKRGKELAVLASGVSVGERVYLGRPGRGAGRQTWAGTEFR